MKNLNKKSKSELADLYFNQMVSLGQFQESKRDILMSACMNMTKSFLVESLKENSK